MHHGLWDYDNPAAPNLLDVTVGGRRVKALAQVTKQGFVYTFDRVTGQPLWPIEERPVPPSDVPGEQAVADATVSDPAGAVRAPGRHRRRPGRFHAGAAGRGRGGDRQFRRGPLFTPPSLAGTLQRPGTVGGANWGGAAVDPETGILYVPSRNAFSVTPLARPAEGLDEQPAATCRCLARGPRMPSGVPLLKPPYSRITAIDMNRGEHVWMTPTGAGTRVRGHRGAAQADPAPAWRRHHLQRAAAHQDGVDLRADDRRHRAAALGWWRTTRPPARSSAPRTCPARRSVRR